MDPKHRRIIHQNKVDLEKKIDLKCLKMPLESSNIFTKAMFTDIYDGKRELLEELPRRGPAAFLKFVDVLKKAGLTSAANRLLKYQYCDPDNINQSSWTDGCCLIINNSILMMAEEMQGQVNVECDALKDAFKSVWKTCEIFSAKSRSEILEILNEFTRKDFSKINVCVVVILSRAAVEQNQSFIYGTDGQYVLESEIFSMFCNVSEDLSYIPKLFLLPYNMSEDASCEKLIKVQNFAGVHLIRWPGNIKSDKLFGESLAECFSDCFKSCDLEKIDLNCILKNAFYDFSLYS